MRSVYLSVAVGCVLLSAMFSRLPAQVTTKQTGDAVRGFEYRVIYLPDIAQANQKPTNQVAAIESKFNELGRDGWELCANMTTAVVFKREKKAAALTAVALSADLDRRDGNILTGNIPTGRRDGDISAPVVYEDLMLVLANGDGAAAVVFTNPTERGVSYRFRYESRDGMKNTSGAGAVFEERENGRYAGGQLFIKAGPFRLGWSDGGAARGWIYYNPEKLKVHIAHAKDFENSDEARIGVPSKKLDLKRFMK